MAREVDLGSIIGPQGPKGETGATGATGAAGKDGETQTFKIQNGHLIAVYAN